MPVPQRPETLAYCHACGAAMNVAAVAPFSNVECPSCGKHTRVKREFGPYTLVSRHAIGGMSMVFIAHDNTLDREVALKILSEEYSADERRIEAFEEEARITASFSHPNVVRVLTTGRAFDRFYIAMELVPGGHFEHQIRERGKIPEIEMLPLAIEVAEGLKAAHAAGLIHRDVKPGNILLDAEGHAKIVDFGLALVTQGGSAQATEVWATPYYVPPETIEGAPEDFRADIYAFGATLYHALSGKPSCGEETMATDVLREAKKKVVPLSVADPSLSVETCRIVEKAMAYQPDDRFSSYEEMISKLNSALKRLASGDHAAMETSASVARRRAQKKRSELLIIASVAAVLLAALVGGAIWVLHKEDKAVKPVITRDMPVIPESNTVAATEIAKNYREARAAVERHDFGAAAIGFAKLRENPEVQEPTRTWAGVEAVVASYLAGESSSAKKMATLAVAHAHGVPDEARISNDLLETLAKLERLVVIPSKDLDQSKSDAPRVMAWMLAGLKDWEQGMLQEAVGFFKAVAEAKLSGNDSWLGLYQKLAQDYLDDARRLEGAVFKNYPATAADCEEAVVELEGLLGDLRTRGRARFNVRAWQLDLAKRAKLLSAPKPDKSTGGTPQESPDAAAVMAKLAEFAGNCRFTEAMEYVKSLPADPKGATRESLLSVTSASAVFLTDLAKDLARETVTGEFPLKSGEVMTKLSLASDGSIRAVDAAGKERASKWEEFSPDALIDLHRYFVKTPKSELETLRRHECAIAYSWLAGDRERALAAANALSQSSPAFKQHWDSIAIGLPK